MNIVLTSKKELLPLCRAIEDAVKLSGALNPDETIEVMPYAGALDARRRGASVVRVGVERIENHDHVFSLASWCRVLYNFSRIENFLDFIDIFPANRHVLRQCIITPLYDTAPRPQDRG